MPFDARAHSRTLYQPAKSDHAETMGSRENGTARQEIQKSIDFELHDVPEEANFDLFVHPEAEICIFPSRQADVSCLQAYINISIIKSQTAATP